MNRKSPEMKTNRDKKIIRWDIILFLNTSSTALVNVTSTSAIAAGVTRGLFYIFLGLFLMTLIDKLLQKVEASLK